MTCSKGQLEWNQRHCGYVEPLGYQGVLMQFIFEHNSELFAVVWCYIGQEVSLAVECDSNYSELNIFTEIVLVNSALRAYMHSYRVIDVYLPRSVTTHQGYSWYGYQVATTRNVIGQLISWL